MTTDTSGFYKGRHFTTYVEEVKALKRAGDYRGAAALLLALVEANETEARTHRWAVTPWYYDQLALVYRKTKETEKELDILERYVRCWRPEDGPVPLGALTAIDKATRRIGRAHQNAQARPPEPIVRQSGGSTTCKSCGLEHRALTRCPRCGTSR